MKKAIFLVSILGLAFLLSACQKTGVEEVSTKDLQDKLKNTDDEFVYYYSSDDISDEKELIATLEKASDKADAKINYTKVKPEFYNSETYVNIKDKYDVDEISLAKTNKGNKVNDYLQVTDDREFDSREKAVKEIKDFIEKEQS